MVLRRIGEMPRNQLLMMWHHIILNAYNYLWYKPI